MTYPAYPYVLTPARPQATNRAVAAGTFDFVLAGLAAVAAFFWLTFGMMAAADMGGSAQTTWGYILLALGVAICLLIATGVLLVRANRFARPAQVLASLLTTPPIVWWLVATAVNLHDAGELSYLLIPAAIACLPIVSLVLVFTPRAVPPLRRSR